MPRPIWSGAVSFGLVTIPIKVVPATESHAISFRQVHTEDGGRIRYRKICELDGKQLRDDEIGKGYEVSKDTIVAVTDEDLAEMPLPTAKAIEIVAFVPAASIDPVRIGTSYYLQPDGQVAGKPYVLLRKALGRSAKVAVAKFALRGRERLGLLQVKEDALVLHTMHWPDEVRSPETLAPGEVELSEDEITGALAVMDTMTEEHLPALSDRYRDALEEVIAAKAAGRQRPAAQDSEQATGGEVVDLMAALNASVTAAKEARGETDDDADVHHLPTKNTATKKTTSKKSPRKKTPTRPKQAG
ncbi:Ku protein [Streptomyces sp. NPDC090029]|uniref:non-homologous end joining protein Ku n=1 Tax=Streptomyces sp. NPDC090029 TaxID=3365924 RepID=UPI003800ED17